MVRNTTPFLLNLKPSEVDEPDITNDEFLDSLDSIGVWLRVLAAYDSLERYTSPDSSKAQRLAALVNIFMQLGAHSEDQAVALVAFSAWSPNRDVALADLFSRLFIKRPGKRGNGSEVQRVHAKLTGGDSGVVRVDQGAFFREAAGMSDAEIVRLFLGYWRSVPSTRLIPKRHMQVWKGLPGELRRVAVSFYDKRQLPRATAAYNKLKHGPQLVVQNPMHRARQFAVTPDFADEISRYASVDKPTVRPLFDGARTRLLPSDGDMPSVAPFLIDNVDAVKKLFFDTMFQQANLLSVLVKMQIALYRKAPINLDRLDEGVGRIVDELGRYRGYR